jgi:phytoene desaturase
MKKRINIIGSGFSSLAASSYLAKAGFEVAVYEKNRTTGGRARQYKKEGFTFDIGPTWYWMPDVFEKFFKDFNKKPSDYYQLERLDPAYQVYFSEQESIIIIIIIIIIISGKLHEIFEAFEKEEKGSSKHLKKFLNSAKFNYNAAMKELVYRPGISPLELVTTETITRVNQFFSTIRKQVRKSIKSQKLIQILEFPVLFLGAKPSNTPAFYNFMNYADFGLGTWHPKGGMYKVVEAMTSLASSLGVVFETDANVQEICLDEEGKITGLIVNDTFIKSDIVLSRLSSFRNFITKKI